ncbi:CCA tRNA nucleotidyltransferase [Limobrevibacterium gyesilva]|uniref:CCA tRNA nucleotidyltransferase n=1 Tax=Limobrevibacterium gyesilva TaxID=2991712 RepID=A0AA42CHT1_9PROT|nr:CCA tRNA nucleotidyltransferase [Limobrevibacterium gyesilva]MCW3477586.1 CCA tRNA nucleotidyltransferase [Limobrevibacterium gyesilva]
MTRPADMAEAPALRIAPPDFVADPAVHAVLAALPRARLVGGCVRDALAGRAVADIDLATPDPPDAVTRALTGAGLRAVPTGLDHGTVTAVSGHRGFEVTTLRRDVATDGRHAVVAYTDDWREDAARRDFTINALSMTADGAVYDYFGGIADLRAGRVRFVGDAATRIAEDYLRILRFFRFHARFGTGAPDPQALAAIDGAVPGLARLSAERVWSELKRILAAPDPVASVALMRRLGVLDAALPEGADPERLARLVATGAPDDPLLRLAALLSGDALAVAERLRLSSAERDRLVALRAGPAPAPDADDATLRRMLADTSKPVLTGRVWLDGGDAGLLARLADMKVPVFPLRGRDLVAAGVPAGAAMGAMLRALRAWWMEGGCTADAAACRAELQRRLQA